MASKLYIFMLLFLCACNGLGPITQSEDNLSVDYLTGTEVVGRYVLAEQSYELIKENYDYKDEVVLINMLKNHQFVFRNTPDFMASLSGNPINGLFVETQGDWNFDTLFNAQKLKMTFKKGTLFHVETTLYFNLQRIDSVVTLSHYIGDPDNGERLLFTKEFDVE